MMRYFVDPLSWGMDSGKSGRGDGACCGTIMHDGSGHTNLGFRPASLRGDEALSFRSVTQNLHFFEAHGLFKLIFDDSDFEDVRKWEELAHSLSLSMEQLYALFNLKLLAKTNQ